MIAEIERLEKEILGEGWDAGEGYVEPGNVDGDDAEFAQRPRSRSAATIGARLAEDPTRYAAEIGDIASLFDAQIDWWESKKPNQDDEDWQDHYEFLKQIRADFSHLTTRIEQLKTQLTPENQQSAGE